MITDIFMRLLNISITAGWIVLAVILARLLLKRAPKWISCLLWAVVGIRLVFPFSIESVLSLIPSANTVEPGILLQNQPTVNTGFDSVNSVVNPIISSAFAPETGASVNPLQIWGALAAVVWVVGIFAMLVYTLITYIRLRIKVSTAVRVTDNIYQCERVISPFILGIFRPRIYVSFGDISGHILAHEKAHLKRGDHFIKPIAFALLAVYWFNPLMWVAYILLCRDIELACDEKVIRSMEKEEKQEYSRTLLEFSIKRGSIAACPLAFGEVGVKSRVKSVMNYKKPAFWIIIIAVIVCVVITVCFLTDPVDNKDSDTNEPSDSTYTEDTDDPDKIDMSFVENSDHFELIYSGNIVSVIMEEEVAYIKEKLSEIGISDEELSLDRSETRSADYVINCYDADNNYTSLNFNIGCREVWQNDYVKPSFSYKVENPDKVKEIFKHNYTDPAVIQYDSVEAEILKRNSNAYYKGDAGVCSYRELVTEGMDGKMFVYLWVLYGEYVRNDDNTVEQISGGSGPVRITFEKTDDGNFYCTDYYAPDKGYEEVFPQTALDAVDKLDIDEMKSELDQKAEKRLTGITYVYKDGDSSLKYAALTLWGRDNFQFTYSLLSSNLCVGKYTRVEDKLILSEDVCGDVYTFMINDKDTDTLTFDEENSTPLPKYKYGTNAQPEVCVPDGAVFNAVYDLYEDLYSFPVYSTEGENGVTYYYAGEVTDAVTDLQDRCVVTVDRAENIMLFRGPIDRESMKYEFVRSGELVTDGNKLYFDHTAGSRYVFDIVGSTLVFNAEESDDSEPTVSDKTVFRLWGSAEEASSTINVTDGVGYILTVNDLEITENKVYLPSGDLLVALSEKISEDVMYKREEGNFLSTPLNKTVLDIDYPYEESGRDGTVITSMDYILKNVPAGTTVRVTITEELKDRLGLESEVIELICKASTLYSDADIEAAIDVIEKEFNSEWKGCTLTDIYYAGDETCADYRDWADRNNADEVIVLKSSFDVDSSGGDGSLNPNSTYDDWMWILVRTDGGEWKHVDHGY